MGMNPTLSVTVNQELVNLQIPIGLWYAYVAKLLLNLFALKFFHVCSEYKKNSANLNKISAEWSC